MSNKSTSCNTGELQLEMWTSLRQNRFNNSSETLCIHFTQMWWHLSESRQLVTGIFWSRNSLCSSFWRNDTRYRRRLYHMLVRDIRVEMFNPFSYFSSTDSFICYSAPRVTLDFLHRLLLIYIYIYIYIYI